MKKPHFFYTNYSLAWIDFRKTQAYRDSQQAMKKKGIFPPYSTNIIKTGFAAGWNASGVKILEVKI